MRFTARLRHATPGGSPLGDNAGKDAEPIPTSTATDAEDILSSLIQGVNASEAQDRLAKILSPKGVEFPSRSTSKRAGALPEKLVEANREFFSRFKARLPKRAVRKAKILQRPSKGEALVPLLPSRDELRAAKLFRVVPPVIEDESKRIVDVHFSSRFNRNGSGALKRLRERYVQQELSFPFARGNSGASDGTVHCVVPTASALDCFKDAFHQVLNGEEHGLRFLILGSVLDQLEAQGFRRTLAWVVELLKRRVEWVYFFCNQFHNQTRKVHQALQWMRKHKEEYKLRLTVVSSNEDFVRMLLEDTFEAMSPECFFRTNFESPSLLKVVDSLAVAQARSRHVGTSGKGITDEGSYEAHWSDQYVADGLHRGELIKGVLRVDARSKGCQDAWVGDILIAGDLARNRAVDNDVVVVFPKSVDGSSSNSRSGRVVAVVNARWRPYVATLSAGDVEAIEADAPAKSDAVVIPMDKRIPKIYISFSNPKALLGQRFVLAIDEWPLESRYPRGHYIKTLGPIGDLTTEGAAILVENGLEGHMYSFSSAALRTLPSKDWTVPSKALETYRDLRDLLVFSVDPVVCQDVDDALSCKILDEGEYEIGVHIADVTSFVEAGSPLDREAARRSTSVYLQDRRLDMLPRLLCEDLCSLRPNVDRLAVSVIWQIRVVEDELRVESCWYGRTVINTVHALSYNQAQRLADGEDPGMEAKKFRERSYTGKFVPEEIRERLQSSLHGLMRIARLRKKGRAAKGALDLSGDDEFGFALDASNLPTEVDVHDHLEVHSTIEELMVFANETVAKEIYRKFPRAALLRRHAKPDEAKLMEVASFVEKLELHMPFKTESNAAIAKSMRTARTILSVEKYSLLNDLLKRRIAEAEYFCTAGVHPDDFLHFGLGLEFYTHFTSPIRRYADVVVHRLLLMDTPNESKSLASHDLEAPELIGVPRSQVPSLLSPGAEKTSAGKHSALLRAYGVTATSSPPNGESPKQVNGRMNTALQEPEISAEKDDLDRLLTQDVSEQAWNTVVQGSSNVDDDLDDLLFEDNLQPADDVELDDLLSGPTNLDGVPASTPNIEPPEISLSSSDNVVTSSQELSEQCAQINKQHRAAKAASRASQDLYLSLLFFRSPQAVQAVIVDVLKPRTSSSPGSGIDLFIPAYQMKLRLHFTSKDSDRLFLAAGVGDTLIDVGAACCKHPNDYTVELSSSKLEPQVLNQLDSILVWISCADPKSLENYARFPRPVAHLLSPDAAKTSLFQPVATSHHNEEMQVDPVANRSDKENSPRGNATNEGSSLYASICNWKSKEEGDPTGTDPRVVTKTRVRERSKGAAASKRGKKLARVTKTKGRMSFGFVRRAAPMKGPDADGVSSRGHQEDGRVKLSEAEVRRKTLEVTRRTQRLAKVKRDDRIKRRKRQQ